LKNSTEGVFWEQKFRDEGTSWGFEPADSAVAARDLFIGHDVHDILIPGIGYGRNARIFIDSGIQVSGIEISQKAIDLARSENHLDIPIYHGSVAEMPFDNRKYRGIFCYALIHLLSRPERRKFISDCHGQLVPGGYMIFTVISVRSDMYGTGKPLSRHRFELMKGLNVFFYDPAAVEREFGKYGLLEFHEIDEPIKHMPDEPPLKCTYVCCRKRG
jgi:SAM-dependent methyltransferase